MHMTARETIRTLCEDLLSTCVGGEHLTHELLLLFPIVVLQVVHQNHISSLLHCHHLTKHHQLQQSNHGNTINKIIPALCQFPDCLTNMHTHSATIYLSL